MLTFTPVTIALIVFCAIGVLMYALATAISHSDPEGQGTVCFTLMKGKLYISPARFWKVLALAAKKRAMETVKELTLEFSRQESR